MHAIKAKNIAKTFSEGKTEKIAVRGIDLSIKKGQVYGFLGPNGAGKTTTIYMLSTLLLPTSGKAEVLGFDIVSESDEIRKRIGLCIGGTHFYYEMNTKEILSYYGMLQGIPGSIRNQKIKELIKDFKMESFANKHFTELSTGMRQKVAIAKALMNDPEVLFLYEPTNGLDVEIALDIRNYIRDRVKETGMTTLLTSHHLYEVEDLCKKITIINDGRIVSEGSIENVKSRMNMPDVARFVLRNYEKIDFIKNIPGVIDYYINENGLFIRMQKGHETLIKLAKLMKTKNMEILDIELRKASLEEVFMKIVGEHDG
jgi:ABC-2 type transport system ATP-binding protein